MDEKKQRRPVGVLLYRIRDLLKRALLPAYTRFVHMIEDPRPA